VEERAGISSLYRESELVPALEAVGFSLNESRAYTALLAESPATGYEVGVRAHIPRSAVYAVLRRLVRVGAARSIAGTPERFVPAPFKELQMLLRRRFEISEKALEEAVANSEFRPPPPAAFSVTGYQRVLEEAERIVRGAEARIVVSGWPREIAALATELGNAARRRVHAVVFSHAELPNLPGEVFSYGLSEAALERFWKHRLIVIADDRRTLIGATEKRPDDDAVISEIPAIADVATSQVALDITLLSQRKKLDVEKTMATMLGPRVGRLDTLMKQVTPKGRRK
jgi:HTH-type transcriptional regulator, sugar sensing transcriptional regulator